jgi:hypothetical protein
MLTLFVTKRIPVEPFDGRSFRFILTRLWLTSLIFLLAVGDGRHVLLDVSGQGLFELMVPLGYRSSRWDDSRGGGWLGVVQFIGQRSDVRTLRYADRLSTRVSENCDTKPVLTFKASSSSCCCAAERHLPVLPQPGPPPDPGRIPAAASVALVVRSLSFQAV